MMRKDIYAPGFKAQPWWWEAWTPNNALSQDPPAKTQVVIIGAGYGGLSTALELRRNGIDCVVLERGVFGIGASTRNGGMISGGTNLGKGLGGKSPIAEEFERKKAELMGAGADSLTVLEDIIAREGIECGLHKNGRFVGAWTPRHYDDMATKVETYNKYANAGASMVPRERQREFIQSDYYYGGMHATRAGHLHPALYYKGLIEAAHKQGAILCANIEAERTEKTATGWRVLTAKGPIECSEVVVATNGYTGDLTPRLKRRVVPVASHIIATEELPEPADKMLIPGMRAIGDTKRVLTYYRPSPDGKRLIFGGRARFTAAPPEVSAPRALPVHGRPLPAARRHPDHPCVDRQRRLRARLHAAHGHRRGAALPAGLQRQRRRHDDLSRHPDRQEDRRRPQHADQPARRPRVPRAPFLQRRSVAGSCRRSAPGTAPAIGSIAGWPAEIRTRKRGLTMRDKAMSALRGVQPYRAASGRGRAHRQAAPGIPR